MGLSEAGCLACRKELKRRETELARRVAELKAEKEDVRVSRNRYLTRALEAEADVNWLRAQNKEASA